MRKFIVGTDWWTDCDDAVALRVLCRALLAGQIQVLGIGINACMADSVTSLEGFLNLEGVTSIPIGIDFDATDYSGKPPYQRRLTHAAKRYNCNEDAQNAVSLYRQLLATSQTPVEIIEIGYPNVLAGLLASQPDDICPLNGFELIEDKVSKLWMMAGKWNIDGGVENNFARGQRSRSSGAFLCQNWPTPITFLGFEIGINVITGGAFLKDDHLYQAMCDHGSANGRHSWDPMLVVMALEGEESTAGYKTVTGIATVEPETGANHFTPDPNGNHKYVIKDKADTYYVDIINHLIKEKDNKNGAVVKATAP